MKSEGSGSIGEPAVDEKVRKRMNVLERKCMRTIRDVRKIDRVESDGVRQRCGGKKSKVERADMGVLKWFGQMDRIREERLTKRIYQ